MLGLVEHYRLGLWLGRNAKSCFNRPIKLFNEIKNLTPALLTS